MATLVLTFITAVPATSIFEVATLNEESRYDYRATMYMCIGLEEAVIAIVWIIGRVEMMYYIADQKWGGSVRTVCDAAYT
ncbi:hypothetical protein V1523DRAFT_428143 [Lipomyces doorenjongii]